MKYLISLALVLATGVFVYANDTFSLVSACRSENAYVLDLAIAEGLGVQLNPSHTPPQEIFSSEIVLIPLENDWVELRAIGVNPAPIEMIHFENVANCQNETSSEENARFVYEAVLAIRDRIGE